MLSKYLQKIPSTRGEETSDLSAPDYEPKPQKRQYLPVSKEEAKKIVQKYKRGLSTNQIAKELHRSRTTISTVLKDAGVTIRQLKSPSQEQITEMTRLYESGLSLERVGERVGFSTKTVHTRLQALRLTMKHERG